MKKRWISAVMALVLVISSGAVLQTGRSAAEEILDMETDEEDCWQMEQDGKGTHWKAHRRRRKQFPMEVACR